ncbi:SixA phosphatase family protein [Paremcibacter congregatus]|uniref:SixA phosphatase family protein n=1 Tax=Paremcibacter congregatus TaxID=2043170 RepID=UPI003A90E0E8
MKRLFLLRHGKAGFGNTDPERPLAPRGEKDMVWLGKLLATKALLPDHILCSSAKRTRETAHCLCQDDNTPHIKTSFHDTLYLASAETLLDHLHCLDNRIQAAMIIGHNPGIATLFHSLINRPATDQRLREFPTGCLVILDFDITDWADLKSNTGQLYCGFVASDARKKEEGNLPSIT